MSNCKRELDASRSRKASVNPLALTLDQALDRFAPRYFMERRLGARTQVEYIADLREACTFLRETCHVDEVTTIRPGHLESYLQRLAHRGLTSATQRRKATSLHVFFQFLSDHRYLGASPAAQLIPPLREELATRFLTDPECQRLLEAAHDHPRDLAILHLFLETGIRRGELANLLVSDLHLPTENHPHVGTLVIRGATPHKGRIVSFTASTCFTLRAYLEHRPDSDDPHLFHSRLRRGLGSWGVEDVAIKYLGRAKILNASSQSLRHTFAIRQINQGVTLSALQALLGHENSRSTAYYFTLMRKLDH